MLPDELIQAARIDGCSEFRIFAQIMLPLAKPALATVAIFSFMDKWRCTCMASGGAHRSK